MSETITKLSETVQQITRSRTCGCRDFYIAKITQNDATGYVAGTPVKLARAIKTKVDEKWTSEKIYSDDGTEEVINSYEGTVFLLRQPTTKHRRSLSDGEKENSTERMISNGYTPESLQRASVRRQAQKRANYLQQQRASRVHSMREVLTMRMRFQSTNQTL